LIKDPTVLEFVHWQPLDQTSFAFRNSSDTFDGPIPFTARLLAKSLLIARSALVDLPNYDIEVEVHAENVVHMTATESEEVVVSFRRLRNVLSMKKSDWYGPCYVYIKFDYENEDVLQCDHVSDASNTLDERVDRVIDQYVLPLFCNLRMSCFTAGSLQATCNKIRVHVGV